MTPLERAVQAAKQALIDDPGTDAYMRADDEPDDFLIDGRVRLTPVVRAVLQAIREPSEGMARQGMLCIATACGDEEAGTQAAPEAWQAMIDAALSE